MTLSYDRDADVLYVTFEKLSDHECIYVENAQGDVLRLDKQSKKVIGVTIPHFAKRASKGRVAVPEVSDVSFNELAESFLA